MKMSMRLTVTAGAPAGAATLLASAMFCTSASAATYAADPASSRIEFTGVQAGAAFKGVFHQFSAAVDFDPAAPAGAHIDVTIDIKSEDTGDKDRDDTMRGADLFDVAHFPTAHYVTRSVTPTATGFSAVGALTLRGVTKDVPIQFKFTSAAAGATLTGTAELKRLDFGVGRGDWKNTDWVADAVKVAFSLNLKPKT
jgi:polyisoprenoid-binding protein YceI